MHTVIVACSGGLAVWGVLLNVLEITARQSERIPTRLAPLPNETGAHVERHTSNHAQSYLLAFLLTAPSF